MGKYAFNQKQMDFWAAQQEAARAMLAALKRLHMCADYDCEEDRAEVSAACDQAGEAIAQAEAAGIGAPT